MALACSPGRRPLARPSSPIRSMSASFAARGNLVGEDRQRHCAVLAGLGAIGPLAAKPAAWKVSYGSVQEVRGYRRVLHDEVEQQRSGGADRLDCCTRSLTLARHQSGGHQGSGVASHRVERELRRRMKIPVFHDDQHGTAIIVVGAASTATDCGGRQGPRENQDCGELSRGRRRGARLRGRTAGIWGSCCWRTSGSPILPGVVFTRAGEELMDPEKAPLRISARPSAPWTRSSPVRIVFLGPSAGRRADAEHGEENGGAPT